MHRCQIFQNRNEILLKVYIALADDTSLANLDTLHLNFNYIKKCKNKIVKWRSAMPYHFEETKHKIWPNKHSPFLKFLVVNGGNIPIT